jgi:hypothetical protein
MMTAINPTEPKRIPIQLDQYLERIAKMMPREVSGYQKRPKLCLWNMTVVEDIIPVFKEMNHLHKMRIAWLAEGNVGVMRYLEKFTKKERLAEVRRVIMSFK